ncbi:unnamed protein product [Heterosigma akashiwo]
MRRLRRLHTTTRPWMVSKKKATNRKTTSKNTIITLSFAEQSKAAATKTVVPTIKTRKSKTSSSLPARTRVFCFLFSPATTTTQPLVGIAAGVGSQASVNENAGW